MKVLFLTEGGGEKGYGHIARCLSLYAAFKEAGIEPAFVLNADDSVACMLSDQVKVNTFDWIVETECLQDNLKNIDIAIVDSYLASEDIYREIAKKVTLLVSLDDDNRLQYPAGVLLNGALGAEKLGYAQKQAIDYMLGVDYFALRPEFVGNFEKEINSEIKNIMIVLGGGNHEAVLARIIDLLNKEYSKVKKTVISRFIDLDTSNGMVTRLDSVDAQTLKDIMLKSDLAISAGGQTLYELVKVGVPTIALGVAQNQKTNLAGWQQVGVIDYIGQPEDMKFLDSLLASIARLADKDVRTKMSQRAQAIVDGQGSKRVVAFLINKVKNEFAQKMSIRKAGLADSKDIWQWRNHPLVLKNSFNSENILWETHEAWFEEKLNDDNTAIYIGLLENQKAGVIRFAKEQKDVTVSVNLNPDFLKRRLGAVFIKKGTETFLADKPLVREVLAYIKADNIASQKAFIKAGYELIKEAEDQNIYKYFAQLS